MTMRLATLACLALAAVLLAGCASSSSVAIESVAGLYTRQHDATIRAHLGKPEGEGPFPAVVLMHGCSGLGHHVRRGLEAHAEALAAAGFATLILDSFGARGTGGLAMCQSSAKMAIATGYRQWDAFHALRFLQAQPFVDAANVFLMGQSHGGGVAFKAAADPSLAPIKRDWRQLHGALPRFRAVVAYYPWCGHLPKRIVSPLLVLSGALDDWTPPWSCTLWKGSVEGAPYDVAIYEGAYHSFDLVSLPLQPYAGHIVGGDAAAAAASRQRMIDWFLAHMEKGG